MHEPHARPKLIAIDLDGTLLDSNGQVSARNAAALQLAKLADVEVVIATGRRHCYAMRVIRDLHLNPTNALVSSNGTVIRTIGSELLHRTHMPRSTARWLCSHISDFRSTLVLTFDTVSPDGEDSPGALVVEDLNALGASINAWVHANEAYITEVSPLEDALLADPPIQMMLCGPVRRMRQAEARLLEHPSITPVASTGSAVADPEVTLHRTEYPDRDLCILDILPADCSKASALRRLAELRGISTDEILAIGDNWNDVPMLELAGHAVLMANAPADLHDLARQHRWTVGVSNDNDGVALAIEAALAAEPALP